MDSDPDFSESDPDFWPIRIWTQKKKSDPDPGKKNKIRNTGYLVVLLVATANGTPYMAK